MSYCDVVAWCCLVRLDVLEAQPRPYNLAFFAKSTALRVKKGMLGRPGLTPE